ncbi:MAG TPA: branched-chain amino acid ABC transporter permease [Acetobacteraceae bacterium]|nr:branched-chain amino acid ABC transporter permease [Acetobacteraceae bacterium]
MLLLQLLVDGILLGGTYVLLAQSLNLIFGVMGVVNLAHGSFIVLAGLFTVWFAAHVAISPLLAIPIAFVVLYAVGAALQPVLLEPLMGLGMQQAELLSLMITFGLDYVLIELGLQVFGSNYVSLPYLQSTWTLGGITVGKSLLVAGVIAGAVALALSLWLNRTGFGKSLLAASQSETGAVSVGINVRLVRLVAFAVGVGLAGVAGTLLILVEPMAAETADNFTILAFVLVALGGLGDYRGVAIASVLLGIAQSAVGFYLGGDAENVLPYVLLILFMAVWPQRFRRAA